MFMMTLICTGLPIINQAKLIVQLVCLMINFDFFYMELFIFTKIHKYRVVNKQIHKRKSKKK